MKKHKFLLHSVFLKRFCWMSVLLCAVSALRAQQFTVERFRSLPNDITAYIQPVKDLNDEACALIKVVGSPDYAFSTPLGIVKREDKVGEIWIYVPRGTRIITIKHPQWGVWRDYRFPERLESRLTYELVLKSPIVVSRDGTPVLREYPYGLPYLIGQSPNQPKPIYIRVSRPREAACFLLMADVSLNSQGTAMGIRAGWMRRHGVNVHALTDLRSTPSTNGMEVDADGALIGGGVPPYYTGTKRRSHYAVLAGATHRIAGRFYLYEGIGYGQRTVVWETDSGQYVRNADYSIKGMAAELGGLFRYRRCFFSAGVVTTGGKYWEPNVGIGISL